MSYQTIYRSAVDGPLASRIMACVSQEAWNNPAAYDTEYGKMVRQNSNVASSMVWPVCVASDIEQAYAYAISGEEPNPNPGGDETVITDGMIIANVQAKWPQDIPV
jgi:hypothetical protein